MVELGTCDWGDTAHKTYNIYSLIPYTEGLLAPALNNLFDLTDPQGFFLYHENSK